MAVAPAPSLRQPMCPAGRTSTAPSRRRPAAAVSDPHDQTCWCRAGASAQARSSGDGILNREEDRLGSWGRTVNLSKAFLHSSSWSRVDLFPYSGWSEAHDLCPAEDGEGGLGTIPAYQRRRELLYHQCQADLSLLLRAPFGTSLEESTSLAFRVRASQLPGSPGAQSSCSAAE